MELETLEEIEDASFLDEDIAEPLEADDASDLTLYIPKLKLSAGQILNLHRRMLSDIDPLYIDLAERTAFCAIKIFDRCPLSAKLDRNTLIVMSVLFTISAYNKEFNFSSTDDYISKNMSNQFLYSFLFLKYLTPLNDKAEALLFYNCDWEKAKKTNNPYIEYASLIFTCARICIQLKKTNYVFSEDAMHDTFEKCRELYNPEYLDCFLKVNSNNELTKHLEDGTFYTELDNYCNSVTYNYEDSFQLLKFMIYSIDFVSTSTVTHIISTAFLVTDMAQMEKLSYEETDEVFTAAVLHDLGKMSVDIEILESPGKLSDEQMAKMRNHVKSGDEIYRNIIPDKIADIASRHHETLDGKGYPMGLSEKDLTAQQRLLSIADIFSALTDARSYKQPFTKEQTIDVLEKMKNLNKLDKKIVDDVKENYDSIRINTEKRRPMLTVNFGQVILNYMQYQDYSDVPSLLSQLHK